MKRRKIGLYERFKTNMSERLGVGRLDENRGLAYEREFIDEFNFYLETGDETETVSAILDIIGREDSVIEVLEEGSANKKRYLDIVSDKNVIVGSKDSSDKFNIGEIITDVTLVLESGKREYISLKWGGTVSYINLGIRGLASSPILSKSEVESGFVESKRGQDFLKFLHIDNERYCETFNGYIPVGKNLRVTNKVEYNYENVTSEYQNKGIMDFLNSAIGYGYIYVHKVGSGAKIEDRRSPSNVIKSINSAHVKFPPIGAAKRIEIEVKSDREDIKMIFRSKNGDIVPTHMLIEPLRS